MNDVTSQKSPLLVQIPSQYLCKFVQQRPLLLSDMCRFQNQKQLFLGYFFMRRKKSWHLQPSCNERHFHCVDKLLLPLQLMIPQNIPTKQNSNSRFWEVSPLFFRHSFILKDALDSAGAMSRFLRMEEVFCCVLHPGGGATSAADEHFFFSLFLYFYQ